jgi:hypothetical protein
MRFCENNRVFCFPKKLEVFVFTPWRHIGVGGITPLILNLGARWRRVVNLTPWPFYPRVRTPVPIELEAGWAPENFWTVLEKRQISCSYRDSNPGPSYRLICIFFYKFPQKAKLIWHLRFSWRCLWILLFTKLMACSAVWTFGQTNCFG